MYTIEQFVKKVKQSKGLVCYGIGERYNTFLREFSTSGILEKIVFCVDKNHENVKQVSNSVELVPVLSKECIPICKEKNYVLLITNHRYDIIYDELNESHVLDGITVFCFTHIYAMLLEEKKIKKTLPLNLKLTKKPVIPKIIHYCWFGGTELPKQNMEWISSWSKYCPDYRIVEWNENNYDVTKNQFMHEAYRMKKWAFVADYARLDIIYNYGGVYLDTDVELISNLDDLLYQEAFFGFEREESIALGLGFGAKKNAEVIKRLRDYYINRHFVLANGEVDTKSSPMITTEYFCSDGVEMNGEYQNMEKYTILPEVVLSGKCPYSRRLRILPCTKSIHHYDATWMDSGFRERNRRFEKEMNS